MRGKCPSILMEIEFYTPNGAMCYKFSFFFLVLLTFIICHHSSQSGGIRNVPASEEKENEKKN